MVLESMSANLRNNHQKYGRHLMIYLLKKQFYPVIKCFIEFSNKCLDLVK